MTYLDNTYSSFDEASKAPHHISPNIISYYEESIF